MTLIYSLAAIFLLSLCCIYCVKNIAYSKNYINNQQNDRWNEASVALYGGVGFIPIFLIFSFILLWFQLEGDYNSIYLIDKDNETTILFGILIGAFLMFLVGIIDDAKGLGAKNKLFFQSVAASIFLIFTDVIFINNHPLLNIIVTYFWFIGIINAVNLLDNMDGLASGVVIISLIAAIYFIINSSLGFEGLSWKIILLLISALAAFWCFNFPPATIFMGDSGSLPLGFLLASFIAPTSLNEYFLPINTNSYPLYIGIIISFSIAIVPIFDTAFVTITRLWDDRQISQGGKDHTSHRLVTLGLHERKVVIFFYLLALIGFGGALLLIKYPGFWLSLLIVQLLLMTLLGIYIGRIKISPETIQSNNVFPFNNQLAEVLMDIGLITLCLYAAFLIRFGAVLSESLVIILNSILPIIIGSSLVSFMFFGVYKKKWVEINLKDITTFAKASIAAVILSIALVALFLQYPDGNSRSVYLIFGLLLLVISFTSRFSFNFLERAINKFLKNKLKH